MSTLAQPPEQETDHFPELTVVTKELQQELAYLRETTVDINVEVAPRSADLFVNDRLIGTGSQTVSLNPRAARNTVSASTVGFLEHHAEISAEDLTSGKICIELERLYSPGTDAVARVSSRVPAWLRDRRRDPQNPVLMRAIGSYLLMIDEPDDAYDELSNLLEVAPSWFMAINQMGFFYGYMGLLDEAMVYYRRVAATCSYHYIGHFNLACVYSLKGDLANSIAHLESILANDAAVEAIREAHDRLSHDPDFKPLIESPVYGPRFREIEVTLFPDSRPHQPADDSYYTF